MGYTLIVEIRRDGGVDDETFDVIRSWTEETNRGLSKGSERIRWQDRDGQIAAYFKPGLGRSRDRDVRHTTKRAAMLHGTHGLSVRVTDDLGIEHTAPAPKKKKKTPRSSSSVLTDIRSVEGGVALTFTNQGSACSAEVLALFDDAEGNTLHTQTQAIAFGARDKERVMVMPVPAGAVKAEAIVRTKRNVKERGRVVEKWDGPGEEVSFEVSPGGTVVASERDLGKGLELALGPNSVRVSKLVVAPTPEGIAVRLRVRVAGPLGWAWLSLACLALDDDGRPIGGDSCTTHVRVNHLGGTVTLEFVVPSSANLASFRVRVNEWSVVEEHGSGPTALPSPGVSTTVEPSGAVHAGTMQLVDRDGKASLTSVVEVTPLTRPAAVALQLLQGEDLLAADIRWLGPVPPVGAATSLSLPLRQQRVPDLARILVVELEPGVSAQLDVPFRDA